MVQTIEQRSAERLARPSVATAAESTLAQRAADGCAVWALCPTCDHGRLAMVMAMVICTMRAMQHVWRHDAALDHGGDEGD